MLPVTVPPEGQLFADIPACASPVTLSSPLPVLPPPWSVLSPMIVKPSPAFPHPISGLSACTYFPSSDNSDLSLYLKVPSHFKFLRLISVSSLTPWAGLSLPSSWRSPTPHLHGPLRPPAMSPGSPGTHRAGRKGL